MRQTRKYDSEPERFITEDFDVTPIIEGMESKERIAVWQGYCRKHEHEEILSQLHDRMGELC